MGLKVTEQHSPEMAANKDRAVDVLPSQVSRTDRLETHVQEVSSLFLVLEGRTQSSK